MTNNIEAVMVLVLMTYSSNTDVNYVCQQYHVIFLKKVITQCIHLLKTNLFHAIWPIQSVYQN